MNILVTGGIGNVGTQTVARLLQSGHEVTVIGRRPDMKVPGAHYRRCDVTDMKGLQAVAHGREAIVHLAALGNPALGTPEVVFNVNCQGTMNVYEAAARAGIRRVVAASSINAVGYGFGVKEWDIQYFPIDEEHPTYTSDSYSFSKTVVEQIAQFYWRREGIAGACLRLPAVVVPPGNTEQAIRDAVGCRRAEFEDLMALTPAERAERVAGWMARLTRAREIRIAENPQNPGVFGDAPLMAGRQDFWTAVDDRDAALAFELALTKDYDGCHVLFINDSHNWAGTPSRQLAEVLYPKVKTWKKPLAGTESLVSIDRARRLLGFEPQHSVSRYS